MPGRGKEMEEEGEFGRQRGCKVDEAVISDGSRQRTSGVNYTWVSQSFMA